MLALTLSLLLANSATATATPSLEAARHAHHLALTAKLERSSSPRDWALASRLVDGSDPSSTNFGARGALLRKAAEAAPSDRLVQWLWASSNDPRAGCSARKPCPDRALAVAKLEPDNIAGWLFVGPKESDGAAAGEAFLHRVAQLPRYDEPTIDAWIAWTELHRAHPTPAYLQPKPLTPASAEGREVRAILTGIAYGSAVAVPMQDLYRFCSRKQHPKAAEARFRDCDRIGQLMFEQSRSASMQLVGLGLRQRASANSDDFAPAKRKLDWRMRQFNALTIEWEPRETLAFYKDLVATGNEIRAQELALARAGVALEAPAGWK